MRVKREGKRETEVGKRERTGGKGGRGKAWVLKTTLGHGDRGRMLQLETRGRMRAGGFSFRLAERHTHTHTHTDTHTHTHTYTHTAFSEPWRSVQRQEP